MRDRAVALASASLMVRYQSTVSEGTAEAAICSCPGTGRGPTSLIRPSTRKKTIKHDAPEKKRKKNHTAKSCKAGSSAAQCHHQAGQAAPRSTKIQTAE